MVDVARQQWEEGNRRLQAQASDPERYGRLLELLEVAMEELRKRVGERFTLAQLADVYGGSDRWMGAAVEERVDAPGWFQQLSVVQDAAFYNYARAATDYTP
jgi:hypothetical protein